MSCLVLWLRCTAEGKTFFFIILQRNIFFSFFFTTGTGSGLKSFSLLCKWLSVCAFSPRDLPVFCEWRDGLRLWSRLVVTRGDSLWSSSWMGKAWWGFESLCYQDAKLNLHPFVHFLFLIFLFVNRFLYQRPYDIHASNSVESLIQLFSTVSVQYNPAWPKDLVSLLRKVSCTLLEVIYYRLYRLYSWIYLRIWNLDIISHWKRLVILETNSACSS